MKHMDLNLAIDFATRTIAGEVVHHLAQPRASAGKLELDTRDILIEAITDLDGNEISYDWGDSDPVHGTPLTVFLRAGCAAFRIRYRTSPEASALQWLDPEQTAGGEHPFLYTQGQSIHTRSWIPCVDNPAHRITYSANIQADLPLHVVMAAEAVDTRQKPGEFKFRMQEPIPTYLIALAAGDLAFQSLGPRTGVWTEPSVLDAAVQELRDTESMVEVTEKIFGPYRWGRYDLLVLPPAFPLGGMENPRLTFATPTILAGDRSLVSLVAHELAHSWSGNLVTNATWNDFWLNEGFTVYLERRIVEAVYGRDRSEMEASLGRGRLEDTLTHLGHDHRDTWLFGDLGRRDPDEAISDVPYEKGYLFLRALEESVGRATFDAFLREYFDRHAFAAMTTSAFVEWLETHLLARSPADGVKVAKWIYAPGLPPNAPRAESAAFAQVEAHLAQWRQDHTSLADQVTDNWSAHEWIHMLQSLGPDDSVDDLARLDHQFAFTTSENCEILCEWLKQGIARGYGPAIEAVEPFLMHVGRGKYVRPLYEALDRFGQADMARRIYAKARRGYHAMVTNSLDGTFLN